MFAGYEPVTLIKWAYLGELKAKVIECRSEDSNLLNSFRDICPIRKSVQVPNRVSVSVDQHIDYYDS